MGENIVNTIVPSFLMGFDSFLQVMRTTTKYWMSWILGQIRPSAWELPSLQLQKFETWILIRFWKRSDQNSGFHGNRKLPRLIMEKMSLT